MIEAKRVPNYKAVFCFEADGGPIFKDWIARLSNAWDAAGSVVQAGPMVESPGIHLHINGNCLMSCEKNFLNWVTRRLGEIPIWGGWDYLLAEEFKKRGWANIPGMRSIYNSPTFSLEQYIQLRKEGCIWCHGCKDDSLINFGRIYMETPFL